MASLRAKQISGSKYTAEDEIQTRFQYDGDMQSCVQYIELLSGVDVTHGGGTAADERLHYKALERDADENGFIGSFHKNHPANLMSICEKCHDQIHAENITFQRKKTTEGYKLKPTRLRKI